MISKCCELVKLCHIIRSSPVFLRQCIYCKIRNLVECPICVQWWLRLFCVITVNNYRKLPQISWNYWFYNISVTYINRKRASVISIGYCLNYCYYYCYYCLTDWFLSIIGKTVWIDSSMVLWMVICDFSSWCWLFSNGARVCVWQLWQNSSNISCQSRPQQVNIFNVFVVVMAWVIIMSHCRPLIRSHLFLLLLQVIFDFFYWHWTMLIV